jgi:hypothetical protein
MAGILAGGVGAVILAGLAAVLAGRARARAQYRRVVAIRLAQVCPPIRRE